MPLRLMGKSQTMVKCSLSHTHAPQYHTPLILKMGTVKKIEGYINANALIDLRASDLRALILMSRTISTIRKVKPCHLLFNADVSAKY